MGWLFVLCEDLPNRARIARVFDSFNFLILLNMASIENSLKYESEMGGARRHPSSDIATQCSLRSGNTAEPVRANPLGEPLAVVGGSPHPLTRLAEE